MSHDRRTIYRENGTISKIEIINFMCHEHLEVNFSPNITFITGPNGSGKSAILAALQVLVFSYLVICRSRSVFEPTVQVVRIRSISSSARVPRIPLRCMFTSVTGVCMHTNLRSTAKQLLSNELSAPLQIQFVCWINSIVSVIVMVITCSGRVITERKKEVMDMLKHFNIKIENPLVFMEQTTMKQFIQGDEKKKYDVLMQAMNFKSLEQK